MNWIAYPVFPAPISGFASGRPAASRRPAAFSWMEEADCQSARSHNWVHLRCKLGLDCCSTEFAVLTQPDVGPLLSFGPPTHKGRP
jgi:hypothetical protein